MVTFKNHSAGGAETNSPLRTYPVSTVKVGGPGSITIMNAWAMADPPPSDGHPYRNNQTRLVCTLCCQEIVSCSVCGKRFRHGDRIAPSGCYVRKVVEVPAPPRHYIGWKFFKASRRVTITTVATALSGAAVGSLAAALVSAPAVVIVLAGVVGTAIAGSLAYLETPKLPSGWGPQFALAPKTEPVTEWVAVPNQPHQCDETAHV
jgi:hypothetical protein